MVSCGSDTKVLLYDLTHLKNTSSLDIKGHTAKVSVCKISPDFLNIVSIDVEGNIIITKI